jgi:hypothetical protein
MKLGSNLILIKLQNYLYFFVILNIIYKILVNKLYQIISFY